MSRFTTLLFRRVGGTWEPQLMHRFTETTSAIPLPSIQKGEQPLNKKALRGLFFIYYISPQVGSPESRTQQLVRSRFWLAPFYVISKALTTRPCNQKTALTSKKRPLTIVLVKQPFALGAHVFWLERVQFDLHLNLATG